MRRVSPFSGVYSVYIPGCASRVVNVVYPTWVCLSGVVNTVIPTWVCLSGVDNCYSHLGVPLGCVIGVIPTWVCLSGV